jgi:hypothetical protein
MVNVTFWDKIKCPWWSAKDQNVNGSCIRALIYLYGVQLLEYHTAWFIYICNFWCQRYIVIRKLGVLLWRCMRKMAHTEEWCKRALKHGSSWLWIPAVICKYSKPSKVHIENVCRNLQCLPCLLPCLQKSTLWFLLTSATTLYKAMASFCQSHFVRGNGITTEERWCLISCSIMYRFNCQWISEHNSSCDWYHVRNVTGYGCVVELKQAIV